MIGLVAIVGGNWFLSSLIQIQLVVVTLRFWVIVSSNGPVEDFPGKTD